MHTVRLVPDYFVRWPVKVDDLDDVSIRERVSQPLVMEIENLAIWWEATFPPIEIDSDPADTAQWQTRKRAVLQRLESELGHDYVADFS